MWQFAVIATDNPACDELLKMGWEPTNFVLAPEAVLSTTPPKIAGLDPKMVVWVGLKKWVDGATSAPEAPGGAGWAHCKPGCSCAYHLGGELTHDCHGDDMEPLG